MPSVALQKLDFPTGLPPTISHPSMQVGGILDDGTVAGFVSDGSRVFGLFANKDGHTKYFDAPPNLPYGGNAPFLGTPARMINRNGLLLSYPLSTNDVFTLDSRTGQVGNIAVKSTIQGIPMSLLDDGTIYGLGYGTGKAVHITPDGQFTTVKVPLNGFGDALSIVVSSNESAMVYHAIKDGENRPAGSYDAIIVCNARVTHLSLFEALAVNDKGDAVGSQIDGQPGIPPAARLSAYINGQMSPISVEILPGFLTSGIGRISNDGTLVGTYINKGVTACGLFAWNDGLATDLSSAGDLRGMKVSLVTPFNETNAFAITGRGPNDAYDSAFRAQLLP
ncbi:hypothetical protein AB4Y32_09800 [Paraburkholderia phymatum]|uniref:Uncharacterized protein n=1 Tax=Paraburkholderia phymatum TaxID=148447 RepID=A0ACC6TXM5_9BURK